MTLERRTWLNRKTPLRSVSARARAYRRGLDRQRTAVGKRSGGQCERVRTLRNGMSFRCTNPAVHVHHRVRRSQGGTNDLSNLVHLCHRCHEWVHANPEAAREEGLMASWWEGLR